MNLTIKGQYKAAGQTRLLKNGKSTQKFYLDIDTETDYPTICEIENYDKKVDISSLKAGDKVIVNVNLSGRKWTNHEGKVMFFQSLSAWKLETEEKKSEPADLPNDEPDDLLMSDKGLPF